MAKVSFRCGVGPGEPDGEEVEGQGGLSGVAGGCGCGRERGAVQRRSGGTGVAGQGVAAVLAPNLRQAGDLGISLPHKTESLVWSKRHAAYGMTGSPTKSPDKRR